MVGQRRRLRKRRAVARRAAPVLVLAAVAAVVGILAAGTVSQIAPASGSFRRTVDTGYAALAAPLAQESNMLGAELASFMRDGSSLSRLAFFAQLDSLASSGSSIASRFALITPPEPATTASRTCTMALSSGSSAIGSLRSGLEGLLGGSTGTGPDAGNQQQALTTVQAVGSQLEGADASWAQCRAALRRAPGAPRLAPSVWIDSPAEWTATSEDHFVSAIAGASLLATQPGLAILSASTVAPSSASTSGELLVPSATSVGVNVVVRNKGNVDEPEVNVVATLDPMSTAPGSPHAGESETISSRVRGGLAAGDSSAVTISGISVEPGSSYTLRISADSGNAFSGFASLTLQVEQAVTTTVITPSSPTVSPGRQVTYTATVSVSVTGLSSPSGSVSFQDDGTTIASCSAERVVQSRATCTVSYPGSGTHALIATYSGDAKRSASTSAPLIEKVAASSGTSPRAS